MTELHQAFRANIAAIIVNENKEFLLVQLVYARPNEWDFAKGGMHVNESEKDTLLREIREELGDVVVEPVERSNVSIVYEWPEELQKSKGFRGQARVSYWTKFISGNISIQEDELRSYAWFSEKEIWEKLLDSGFPKFIVNSFEKEWQEIRNCF